MKKLHRHLESRYNWYSEWHKHPKYGTLHWLVFIAFIIASVAILQIAINKSININVVEATTWETPKQLTTIQYYTGLAASGQTVHFIAGDGTVYYRRSLDNGQTWSSQVNLGYGTPYLEDPLVIDGSNVYVSYVRDIRTVSDYIGPRPLGNIYMRVSRDNGQTWGPEVKVTNAQSAFRLTVTASGSKVHIAWMDYRSLNTWDIYYRRSIDYGATWQPEVKLVAGINFEMSAGRPAMTSIGDILHLTWMDGRDDKPLYFLEGGAWLKATEIYYKRSTDGGVSWGPDVRLTNHPSDYAGRPAVTAISPSTILVSYDYSIDGSLALEEFLLRSTDNGVTWQAPLRLSTDTGDSTHNDMEAEASRVHMVWSDSTSPTTGGVYHRSSTDSGATWVNRDIVGSTGGKVAPMIALTDNYVHVTWGGWYYRRSLEVTPLPIAPSITTQPASKSVTAGQSASFSVVASGTTPLSYQWRKNGTSITGATSSSYTTPATTSVDNGALYSVVVTNSVGSVTSSNATLSVTAFLDTTPPTVSISSPISGATVSGTVSITATASDNVGVTGVEFRRGSTILGTDTSSPYAYSWNTTTVTNGSYSLTAIAKDAYGNSTTSTSVSTTVNNITVTPPPVVTNPNNLALASNGSVATASSIFTSSFPAGATNNGDRKGLNWGAGGGWKDLTDTTYTDWLKVDFNETKAITEIDVFTIQDNYTNPSDPTSTMTFTQYGITDFQVQTWNGASWQTVPGGSVTGNNLVWRKFVFPAISTNSIRVLVSGALTGYSRIMEIEAYGTTTTADTTPPTVSISYPTNGVTVSNTVNISATASDNVGVTSVEFRNGSTVLGTDTSSPYAYSWNTTTVANGSYSLTAVARDAYGNTKTSTTVSVTTSNTTTTTPDTTPPIVSIIKPLNNGIVTRNTTITIEATATDNVAIAKVEFYVKGVLKCTETMAPYTCVWKIPKNRNAIHVIQAKAYDKAGNTSITFSTVTSK